MAAHPFFTGWCNPSNPPGNWQHQRCDGGAAGLACACPTCQHDAPTVLAARPAGE